jgi:DNA-binding MarR family transcriptional regulator
MKPPNPPPPVRSDSLRHDRSEFNVVFVHSALDDLGLSPAQFRVYCHLARRANAGSGIEGSAWPAVSEIARLCRLHEDTVRAALRWLAAHRLLTRERRPGATGVYRLTAASHWLRPNPSESDTPPSVSGDTPPNPMEDHPSEKRGDEGDPFEGYPLKEHTHPAGSSAPRSLEEVEAAASMHGICPEAARVFYHEGEANGWLNKHGHPIRNWQSALQAYGEKWRAVEHQRAARPPRSPNARLRTTGAFAAIPSADAFTRTEI